MQRRLRILHFLVPPYHVTTWRTTTLGITYSTHQAHPHPELLRVYFNNTAVLDNFPIPPPRFEGTERSGRHGMVGYWSVVNWPIVVSWITPVQQLRRPATPLKTLLSKYQALGFGGQVSVAIYVFSSISMSGGSMTSCHLRITNETSVSEVSPKYRANIVS